MHRCVETAAFEALSDRKWGSEDYELGWKKQRKGVAGDWKNIFTERDKAIYKEVAGNLLMRLDRIHQRQQLVRLIWADNGSLSERASV